MDSSIGNFLVRLDVQKTDSARLKSNFISVEELIVKLHKNGFHSSDSFR